MGSHSLLKEDYFKFTFNIPELCRRQFVIEDHQIYIVFLYEFFYFSEFSASYISSCIRFVYFLNEFPCTFSPCRLGKEFKFVKVLHYLSFVITLLYDAYEYCLFFSFFHMDTDKNLI